MIDMAVVELNFWRWVDMSGDCWLWTRGRTTAGYGSVHVVDKRQYAHRLAYEFVKGPIPEGMSVCHSCDNPPCVNPDHLFLGSHTENIQDSAKKGRMHPGEKHGLSKLNADQVLEIRRLCTEGFSPYNVARMFGVSRSNIQHIVRRSTWKHLVDPWEDL